MDFWAILAAVFGGSFFGSFLGPLLLDEWKQYRRRHSWERPRERLIRQIFVEIPEPIISLRDIAIRAGASPEETRDILVQMGAMGTTMSNGDEGWSFDRSRWKFVSNNVDRAE